MLLARSSYGVDVNEEMSLLLAIVGCARYDWGIRESEQKDGRFGGRYIEFLWMMSESGRKLPQPSTRDVCWAYAREV